jgi:hypothetical protein
MMAPDPNLRPPRRRRRLSPATLRALALGAALFWAPALLLQWRIIPGENFLPAIALFGFLVPLTLLAAWRAWFDSPTRAERLAHWVRLAIAGPYLGAIAVGAATFFAGGDFDLWRTSPTSPAASGILLPLALLTVRPSMMLLKYSLFVAAAAILIVTLFIPKGAHRPLDA